MNNYNMFWLYILLPLTYFAIGATFVCLFSTGGPHEYEKTWAMIIFWPLLLVIRVLIGFMKIIMATIMGLFYIIKEWIWEE